MKLWIDDIRPAPEGYRWIRSVERAIFFIDAYERIAKALPDEKHVIELIDIDHDAGEFVVMGGDYIKLLDWFEETGRNYPIHIHSMNPVGVANMRAIIKRNGWTEV